MTSDISTSNDRLAATLSLDEPVGRVRLVSPARAKALENMGIVSVRDLVTHFPRRYIDLSCSRSVSEAKIGETCTISGTIRDMKLKKPKPRLNLVEIALVDDTGALMITAFRQPWLMDQLKVGMTIAVAGKIEFDYGFKRMTNPFIEAVGESSDDDAAYHQVGRVIPVHPACEKISTAWMRRIVGNAVDATRGMLDPLPVELRRKYRLMSRGQAIRAIHFPQSMDEVKQAKRRLAYEELLFLELMLMEQSIERSAGQTPVQHVVDGVYLAALSMVLPFELTKDQASARDDILRVMSAPQCANHLLLGDVGTGKTAVAAHALAAVADSGTQALFLAPTEVLAQQHGKSLGELLGSIGITTAVLTGSTPAAERERIVGELADGSLTVLIGTHALLEDDVQPKNCSLVVIDEQQRFGVEQRSKIMQKGLSPDALYLTATPIPRTLALAVYGDLTLSYLHDRPHASAQRDTRVLQKDQRGYAYDAALEALRRGEQVYVVCPLVGLDTKARNAKAGKTETDEEAYEYGYISIESEDDLDEGNVAAATKEASMLQQQTFSEFRVELLHGKMPSAEKQAVMQRFSSGETHVLVATTVIEVGVDVPNATVMIIEDADRFGLSQLHQLRGRVGRGTKSAQVFLVSASKQDTALDRLRAMESTDDGFKLASYDLSLRQEGDILGNRQHGASSLKLVNVVRDGAIIEAAHADARAIIERDASLSEPEHKALAREMRMTFRRGHVSQGG